MFFVRNGFLIVLLFCGMTEVYSQMDVILKRPESGLNRELPEVDTNSESIDSSPYHDINNEMRRIGEQIDSQINERLNVMRQENLLNSMFNEQGLGQIPKGIANLDSSADEENPLLDFMKFVGDSLPDTLSGSRGSSYPMLNSNQEVLAGDEEDQNEKPLRVYTIIRINDDDNFIPFENDIIALGGEVPRNGSGNADVKGLSFQEYLKSFVDAMKNMVDLVRNSTDILRVGETNNRNGTDQPVDIKIKDHGRIYEIPPDAHVERSNPGMVNITWRSGIDSLNNSLYMNIDKDKDGALIFHHIRLRILEGNGLQEYNREDSIRLKGNENNSSEINLAEGVGLKIPHPDSLDVVLIEKREKFSAQWMAVSIALLGLMVAGLVLMLSYILHARNRYNSRKDSMFKEPIA
ncbi:uncharacterized protein LOC123309873 [Coccinella septempunctata]|uniref:uncharacterized protein LOC123309873 n=1 Tax=Coccinella septempunctata TaxID=41139 RepID=UPI001D071825|nr:uncharacterized protein LOC123309873 [Coccinella septempunctata]XP_044749101.1 uncharacterized protein LOC123309873 [Coccinella septempunctata]